MIKSYDLLKGKFLLADTYEAMRIITIEDNKIYLSLQETGFIISDEIEKITNFLNKAKAVFIDEEDYKYRVVAVRLFLENRDSYGYPYKHHYLNQYNELRITTGKEKIYNLFDLGGGFEDDKIL